MKNNPANINKNLSGSILMLVVIFTSLFFVVAVGLVSLAVSQNKLGLQRVSHEQALKIAEAGINYYRWHLAHDPMDYQDGTGLPGPYVHDYDDPYGDKIGEFSLEITPPNDCSNEVVITSTGYTMEDPDVTRTLRVIYGKPSLADYAFLTNSNAWFGSSESLSGPVHSNGGIRMDGSHNTIITSSKDTYICGEDMGCDPSGETKPGIWGAGGDPLLWEFPEPVVDFNMFTADIAFLKGLAQASGIYIPQHGQGYHVVFKNDGTFDLYEVDQLETPAPWGWDGFDWKREKWDIKNETFLQNYTLPPDCSILFIEDHVWVDGIINGEVTLVAGKLPEVKQNHRNIIINDDLVYLDDSGNNVLGLIAQGDILVPLYSAPDDLEINGALLAQNGHVFRYYYPNWYSPDHLKNSIELYGVIISNTTWTWSWVNGSGTVISGYDTTITNYDPNLKFNPPPGFPTEGDYGFIKWEEIN